MHNPGARIVCFESNSYVVTSLTDTNDVTAWRIGIVVSRAASTTDDIKSVLSYKSDLKPIISTHDRAYAMQMNWMLYKKE